MSYYNLISLMPKQAIYCSDPDGQAFLVSAGITNTIQHGAICSLVADLKSSGLWSKMDAIYPFVGGTATSHKFNLKDPRNLNIAFRLTPFGGLIHNSNGVTGNGFNAYFDTNININSYRNSNHVSIYSRTNIDEVSNDAGVINANGTYMTLASRLGGLGYFGNHVTGQFISNTVSDSRGLFTNSRTSSNLFKAYRNSTILATDNINATSETINHNMFLLARNQQGVNNVLHSTRNIAFASFGTGLTDSEVNDLNTIVNTFQTTLGRNI